MGPPVASKRKFVEANVGEELLNKLDTLTDHVLSLNEKYENCIEEIKRLRKGNEKLKKITYTIAHTHKFVSLSFLF